MVAGPFPTSPYGGAFGIVEYNGETVRLWELTPEERAKLYQQMEQEAATQATATAPSERTETQTEDATSSFSSDLESLGFFSDPLSLTLEQALSQSGIDMQNEDVRHFLTNYPDIIWDDENHQLTEQGAILVGQMANDPRYAAAPSSAYEDALMQSGFSGAFPYEVSDQGAELARRKPGFTPESATKATSAGLQMETSDDTGWIRYENGVLVSPDGQVAYDPTSKAPGSMSWLRETVGGWSDEKVKEWKARLYKLGYLSKEQSKVAGLDTTFQSALSAYHANRYVNGGKPLQGPLAADNADGGGVENRVFDLREVSGQVRNGVREQYARIFGTEATDGEVAAWSDYIIGVGMDMQRKWRNKYGTSSPDQALTEASERAIEQLEQSPEAKFLRTSTEENTRLHDALQRAVQVTTSLAG